MICCARRHRGPQFPQEAPPIPNSREVARLCALVAEDKKADDIVVLDISKLSFITDYFVIATGQSAKQLQAIALELESRLGAVQRKRYGKEGYEVGSWILIDFGDVVVHLFHKDLRKHYDLESNWADARRVDWKSDVDKDEAAADAPQSRSASV